MADVAVQPTAVTFHILTGIYTECGMEAQLEDLKQLQKTMAVLAGTR